MSDKTQKLVLGIIDFLNASIGDGTVKEDDRESLEVAIQCIGEAFGVDPSDDGQRTKLSIKPATLPSIFDVYLKTQAKMAASSQASTSAPKAAGPTAADKAEAEKLKSAGNAHMTRKDYAAAIASYTQAIARDPTNPVYYSNRAAAYSSDAQHVQAVADAEKAIQVDKSFVKSYHRLGHAHYALGNFAEAAAAFKQGLDLEPSNANLKTGYDAAKARIPESADDEDDIPPAAAAEGGARGAPDLSSLAGMFGGGGAGGGGMPDLGSLLSNPAIAGIAQQLMGNGGLESLMSNPALANMMQRMQSGGGMPSRDELMSDPALRNLAQQYMGGDAGRGAGGA
ncbi:TPR-like protein [Auricularia subglabra TFB-10046 SS5]|nr:TPR-like protein [Auricularia subglabra TFB-10046 SS5]